MTCKYSEKAPWGALAVFALVLAFVAPPAVAAEPIIGQASVIDGDTIEIGGEPIRLYGIDAPETAQKCIEDGKLLPCGEQAAAALAEHIGGQTVTCKPKGRDREGLVAAVCSADGDDLNRWMVGQGLALAFQRSSRDYVRQEKRAAKAKAGIWRGWFVKPWEWRGGERLVADGTFEENACIIKGNIARGGKRVYHVPGGQYYGPILIEEEKGERYFCTEEEAQQAGWRKSKR